MVHEQTEIHVVRIQMESEQGASLRIIASVSHERALVRHDAYDLHNSYRRSEEAAQLSKIEV